MSDHALHRWNKWCYLKIRILSIYLIPNVEHSNLEYMIFTSIPCWLLCSYLLRSSILSFFILYFFKKTRQNKCFWFRKFFITSMKVVYTFKFTLKRFATFVEFLLQHSCFNACNYRDFKLLHSEQRYLNLNNTTMRTSYDDFVWFWGICLLSKHFIWKNKRKRNIVFTFFYLLGRSAPAQTSQTVRAR